jgi:hypothetical protein
MFSALRIFNPFFVAKFGTRLTKGNDLRNRSACAINECSDYRALQMMEYHFPKINIPRLETRVPKCCACLRLWHGSNK